MTPPREGREAEATPAAPPSVPRWRLPAGIAFFALALICPLFIPLAAFAPLPASWRAVISGGLAVGIPELLTLAAIALLGKPGFELLKKRFHARLARLAPAARVGRTRYRIGLAMFVVPILAGWTAAYFPGRFPGYARHPIAMNLAGDILFLSSLFVLGGDFWNKVRALFVCDAKAEFPPPRD